MKTSLFVVIVSSLVLFASGAVVDQSQTLVDFVNDEGDGSGQTFTANKDGLLVGIRLCLRDHNYPRDFRITLNSTSNGNPTTNVITSVDVSGSMVSTGAVQWYEFRFDKPSVQQKGDVFAFIYYSLTPGNPRGWNDLAFDTTQSYSNGHHFILYSNGSWTTNIHPHVDYSFETLVVPTSSLASFTLSNMTAIVSMVSSETSMVYRLQYSTNLTSGVWLDHSSTTGTATEMNWQVPNSTNKTMFFRIITEER